MLRCFGSIHRNILLPGGPVHNRKLGILVRGQHQDERATRGPWGGHRITTGTAAEESLQYGHVDGTGASTARYTVHRCQHQVVHQPRLPIHKAVSLQMDGQLEIRWRRTILVPKICCLSTADQFATAGTLHLHTLDSTIRHDPLVTSKDHSQTPSTENATSDIPESDA